MPGRNVSRRMVMGVLGSSVVVAPMIAEAFSGVTSASLDGAPDPLSTNGPELLAPFSAGSRVARWVIVDIKPLELGAVVVTLRGDDGHDFRVEILARDTSGLVARPPAETAQFALHVCNGGDGWLPTVEEQGLAAMTLAQIVARNEQAVALDGFLTHADRINRHRNALLVSDASSTSAS